MTTQPTNYLPDGLIAMLDDRHARSISYGATGLCALRDGAFVNKSACKEYREAVLRSLDTCIKAMWDRQMKLDRDVVDSAHDLYYTFVDSGPMLGSWLKRAAAVIAAPATNASLRAELVALAAWITPISRDLLCKETLAKVQSGKDPAALAASIEARRQAEIASGKIVMTCSCCYRDIAFDKRDGRMHHHGYERPGYGYQTASCLGVGFAPLENAVDGVLAVLAMDHKRHTNLTQRLASRAKWTEILVLRHFPIPGGPRWKTETKLVSIKRGEAEWAEVFKGEVASIKLELKCLVLEIAQRSAVRDAWKLGMNQNDVVAVHSAVKVKA